MTGARSCLLPCARKKARPDPRFAAGRESGRQGLHGRLHALLPAAAASLPRARLSERLLQRPPGVGDRPPAASAGRGRPDRAGAAARVLQNRRAGTGVAFGRPQADAALRRGQRGAGAAEAESDSEGAGEDCAEGAIKQGRPAPGFADNSTKDPWQISSLVPIFKNTLLAADIPIHARYAANYCPPRASANAMVKCCTFFFS